VNFLKGVFAPTTFQEAREKTKAAVEAYTSSIVILGAATGIELLLFNKKLEVQVDDFARQLGEFSATLRTCYTGTRLPVAF
jgi:hypothetical protein